VTIRCSQGDVSSSQKEYAQEIATRLTDLGLFADVDNGADTLPKKIRNGEIAQYNFILGERLALSC
jgi:threonyl-tRNA synthetase